MAHRHLVPPTGPDDPGFRTWTEQVSTILSESKAYGGMHNIDANLRTEGIAQSAITITSYNSLLPSNNVSVSTLLGTLTVGKTADYHVTNYSSFTGTANTEYHGYLFVNGSEHSLGWGRKMGTGGDVGSASFGGVIYLEDGDVLATKVEAVAGSGQFIGMIYGQFTCHEV